MGLSRSMVPWVASVLVACAAGESPAVVAADADASSGVADVAGVIDSGPDIPHETGTDPVVASCAQVPGPVLEFRWETDWPDADPADRRTAVFATAKVILHGDAPADGSTGTLRLATFEDAEGRPFRLFYALPDDRMLPVAVGDDVVIDAVTVFTWWLDTWIVIRAAADPDTIVFFGQDACAGGVSDTKPDDWNACTGAGACPSVAFAGDACPVQEMQLGSGVHEDIRFRLNDASTQDVPWQAVVEDTEGRMWVNAYNYRITDRSDVADAPFTWLRAAMIGAP